MIEKVAIPVLDDEVAPCFEVAHYFVIAGIEEKNRISETIRECGGCEGYGRIRFLISNKVNILICNGIKQFYLDLLNISGIEVISDIADSVENALMAYLLGEIIPGSRMEKDIDLSSEIPHDDLVCWARELFESNGFEVTRRPNQMPFLIDLVAEIPCPLCRKKIRVGICCGAHTYRAANEIMEFHHTAPNEFSAKVYVYPSNPKICQRCMEYGIELIDPNSEDGYPIKMTTNRIPILRNPINGHEKACLSFNNMKG